MGLPLNFVKSTLPAGLYLVATPIGASRDITLRALDTLASADILVAEDCRALRKLLDIHSIKVSGRRLLSYHDYSVASVRRNLTTEIENGQSVAYTSEAGMPLIADPGFKLVDTVIAAGHLVTVVPGVSASLAGLTLSGLPSDCFFFSGFLPKTTLARKARFKLLIDVPGTLIFYESPRRTAAMISDAITVLGPNRKAAICREITKRFEERIQGTLSELADYLTDNDLKGEVVVLIDRERSKERSTENLNNMLRDSLKLMSVRDTVDLVSETTGVARRKVYQLALSMMKNAVDE